MTATAFQTTNPVTTTTTPVTPDTDQQSVLDRMKNASCSGAGGHHGHRDPAKMAQKLGGIIDQLQNDPDATSALNAKLGGKSLQDFLTANQGNRDVIGDFMQTLFAYAKKDGVALPERGGQQLAKNSSGSSTGSSSGGSVVS